MRGKSNVTELWSVADRFFQFAAQDTAPACLPPKCDDIQIIIKYYQILSNIIRYYNKI